MQEKHLYEYAVVRVVPRVEREEFINVGVILYCPSLRFLKVLSEVDSQRLYALTRTLSPEEVREYLRAFDHICQGGKLGGAIGQLPLASRFRWLTAVRSSVMQTSRVHPGFCADPEAALRRLFEQLVC